MFPHKVAQQLLDAALYLQDESESALKENSRMRSIGLGWSDYVTPWSVHGRNKTVDELRLELNEGADQIN